MCTTAIATTDERVDLPLERALAMHVPYSPTVSPIICPRESHLAKGGRLELLEGEHVVGAAVRL